MVKNSFEEDIENIIIKIWFKEFGFRSKDLDKRRILKKFKRLTEEDINYKIDELIPRVEKLIKESTDYFHKLTKILDPRKDYFKIKSLEFPKRCVIVEKTGDRSECEFLYSSLNAYNSWVQLPTIQPQGRWFSLGDSWSQYLLNQGYIEGEKLDTDDQDRLQGFEFHFDRDRYAMYEVVFERQTPKVKTAIINSFEAASSFYQEYKKKKFGGHGCQIEDETIFDQEVARVDYKGHKIPVIDWIKVAKDFAGIEFDLPIYWLKDKTFQVPRDELAWMLGIDIRSGCVWNDSIIQTFRKVTLPMKDQVKEWHGIFETPIR